MIQFKIGLALLCLITLFISKETIAQTKQGILFSSASSWKQIVQQAKQQHKLIFVDAFATWCGPCKAMDKEVYADTNVGGQMNTTFISLKIQMDITPKDNPEVKAFYADAKELADKYNVRAYPTFLFFNEDGNLIHQDLGYKSADEFLSIVKNVQGAKNTYASKLMAFRKGAVQSNQILELYIKTKELGNKPLADSLALCFKLNYLDELSEKQLLTLPNLMFLQNEIKLVKSKDLIFRSALAKRQDSTLNAGALTYTWANYFVQTVIIQEEVTQLINDLQKKTPSWNELARKIKIKYPMINAEEVIGIPKMNYFLQKKDYKSYVKAQNEYFKNTTSPTDPIGAFFRYNGPAWNMFLASNDKSVLKEALKWSDKSIQAGDNAQYLDTRANLLYKLGRVKEAIAQEEVALLKEKNRFLSNGWKFDEFHNEYYLTLQKMQVGLPTWPKKENTAKENN